MLEKNFQRKLVQKLKVLFPDSIVIKTDPTLHQGLPDLLILYEKKWAALEVKKSKDAAKQPNQEYWVKKMKEMSYSSFIYPENEKEVLHELEQTFKT